MSDTSARLGLPYLAAGQMQKHVTLNEALTRLDGLVQCGVASRSLTVQPAEPADGALYILPDGAEGTVWSLHPPGSLMRAEGSGWSRVAAPAGLIAVIADTHEIVVWHDGDWTPLSTLMNALQNLERLGVGATADAANPFLAKLNSALWTARDTGDGGTGDLRLVLNKAGPSAVLSLILQSGWSGRAELGLIGEDVFGLKVSPDGSTWSEVMRVDPVDGQVRFLRGASRRETLVVTEDAVWSPPEWARWVEATVVGAGGGGGPGAWGAAGTGRPGGGGGGGGGLSHAVWAVDSLPGALDLTIGEGGAPGGDGGLTRIQAGGVQLLAAAGGSSGSEGGDPGAAGDGLWAGASGGGGSGGGLTAADAVLEAVGGGSGGALLRPADGGAAGSDAAGSPGAPVIEPLHGLCGGGGGGGSASLTSGYDGGQGGLYGAGGGGGGAGVEAGGAGGAGANGVIVLVCVG